MKNHLIYKWLRRMAMLSGIPILAMMFATCKKYGVPDDMRIWGQVRDNETKNPIAGVKIETENHDQISTNEYGSFNLYSSNCQNLIFSKDGYQSKDTTLCPNTDTRIFLQKQPEE